MEASIEWLERPVVYRIDDDDVIVFVNDAWRLFAETNGESDLGRKALGRSLWPYLTDPSLKRLYKELVEKVRSTGEDVRFGYRCDSPIEKRYLEMTIRERDGLVEFQSRFLRIEPQDPRAFFDRMCAGLPEAIPVCSICEHLGVGGIWEDALRTFQEGRLSLEDTPLVLAPTLCPDCEAMLARKAG